VAQGSGLAVDPLARVANLSVGERQRVEILKALYRGARVLVLDEPTAVLTPQESQSLFATLRQLVRQGMAVIFISHKLDEVMDISQRVLVLRGGRVVAETPPIRKRPTGALDAATVIGLQRRRAGQRCNRPAAAGVTGCRWRAGTEGRGAGHRRRRDLGIAGVSGNGRGCWPGAVGVSDAAAIQIVAWHPVTCPWWRAAWRAF
jgi:simple sugar transport system ATP-binding protein